MQKRTLSILIIAVLTLILLDGLFGFSKKLYSRYTATFGSTIHNENVAVEPPPEESQPEPIRITLAAAGDIMVHLPQIKAAYNAETDTYEFTECFADIKELVQSVDLAICNLETVLAGPDRGYSGYPDFNAPDEIAVAIKEAGFDVVSLANNHSLDKGPSGIYRTIDYLRSIGLIPIGSIRSEEEKDDILLLEVGGISLAVLAYTYGVNSPYPTENLVSIIDEEKIAGDIAKAKDMGAELVAVSIHWGTEYKREPNQAQKNLAEKMIEFGADIILGSHPHVIQPFDKVEVALPSGETREGYVIYSLGNFISNQNLQTLNMKYVDSGVILTFTIEKDPETGEISIPAIGYTPTWVHKFFKDGKDHYRIVIVEDAIKEYESGQPGDLSEADYLRLKEVLEETREQFRSLDLELAVSTEQDE